MILCASSQTIPAFLSVFYYYLEKNHSAEIHTSVTGWKLHTKYGFDAQGFLLHTQALPQLCQLIWSFVHRFSFILLTCVISQADNEKEINGMSIHSTFSVDHIYFLRLPVPLFVVHNTTLPIHIPKLTSTIGYEV